ncbi:MAG: 16S rRNA (cytosine(1402)-N(4))-methyltransferase RsmH [Ruminococcus sp.]|nr:16S rRNA (cytosine(1402)-N(4))-methyltransferase RsmH [Ruminococcus sp.]MCD7800070.1 16S rRNA (cytosine(1402)-N(4))-methyltransferase RsmH [Ruminococcus sp.]
MEFNHVPVLLHETLQGLNIQPNGIYVDCTVGGAGHSIEIAKKLSCSGRLICLDRDPDAIQVASERLKPYNATILQKNYSQIKDALETLNIDCVDGILMDLGVSSHQLDTVERGFSYHYDAPLDMRMSQSGVSAFDIVNRYSYEQLSKILFEFGEERFSNKIASNIVKFREVKPIATTLQLAEIVGNSIPAKFRRDKNPCKKTFQAIRMEVNGELEHLSIGLDDAFDSLKVGGRLAIIDFHSLEDRLVKQRFANLCRGCTCPPDFPQCVCGKKPRGRLVNRKPIEATDLEVKHNNRSRSAKLRVIERI